MECRVEGDRRQALAGREDQEAERGEAYRRSQEGPSRSWHDPRLLPVKARLDVPRQTGSDAGVGCRRVSPRQVNRQSGWSVG